MSNSEPPGPLALLTKELPPPPANAPSGSLSGTPLADHQSHPEHVASKCSQDGDACTEAEDGAVLTGAEGFWPSADTDDSDTVPAHLPVERDRNRRLRSPAWLGHDADDCLELQHNMLREVLQGKIHLAPVEDPATVLDLGAAPGTWALVMNIITDAWDFSNPFDFIHLRMLGELLPSSTISSIYGTLSPGGWLEISEWVQILQCPDHSLEGTSFARWDRAYQRGRFSFFLIPLLCLHLCCQFLSLFSRTNNHPVLRKSGNPATYPYRYKDMLQKAGFRRIHVRKHAVPTNAWPNSRSLQRIGHMQATNLLSVVDILSRDKFVHVLGWTSQEADALIAQVRHEGQESNLHGFYTLYSRFCPHTC
ncbi:hypothetical protein PG985_014800 [Apiospora marii]|uniref:uncharacterized protein n=1 Tax=Apiospora marii TaxID=335849 RepID=UPI00312D8A4C